MTNRHPNSRPQQGARNANAKLDERQVRTIRRLRHLGSERLAERFLVTRGTINCILRGRIWAHILN